MNERTFAAALKKKEFAEHFWGFCHRVKHRTLKMVLPDRVRGKTSETIFDFSAKNGSVSQKWCFQWFF
jgi:hypothetical protein